MILGLLNTIPLELKQSPKNKYIGISDKTFFIKLKDSETVLLFFTIIIKYFV